MAMVPRAQRNAEAGGKKAPGPLAQQVSPGSPACCDGEAGCGGGSLGLKHSKHPQVLLEITLTSNEINPGTFTCVWEATGMSACQSSSEGRQDPAKKQGYPPQNRGTSPQFRAYASPGARRHLAQNWYPSTWGSWHCGFGLKWWCRGSASEGGTDTQESDVSDGSLMASLQTFPGSWSPVCSLSGQGPQLSPPPVVVQRPGGQDVDKAQTAGKHTHYTDLPDTFRVPPKGKGTSSRAFMAIPPTMGLRRRLAQPFPCGHHTTWDTALEFEDLCS